MKDLTFAAIISVVFPVLLSAQDGSLRWAFPTGNDISLTSPALAADGTVYVGSLDGNLYAVNGDGTLKWNFPAAQITAVQISGKLGQSVLIPIEIDLP